MELKRKTKEGNISHQVIRSIGTGGGGVSHCSFYFMHVALGMDFQDYCLCVRACVCVWRYRKEKKKGFPGICAFTLKIKPSKNPVREKKAQAGSCIGVLLTRIVNVPGIKKQSCVQYDTSPHAFMSPSVRLVLQKLWIELSTRGTIKVAASPS